MLTKLYIDSVAINGYPQIWIEHIDCHEWLMRIYYYYSTGTTDWTTDIRALCELFGSPQVQSPHVYQINVKMIICCLSM